MKLEMKLCNLFERSYKCLLGDFCGYNKNFWMFFAIYDNYVRINIYIAIL